MRGASSAELVATARMETAGENFTYMLSFDGDELDAPGTLDVVDGLGAKGVWVVGWVGAHCSCCWRRCFWYCGDDECMLL